MEPERQRLKEIHEVLNGRERSRADLSGLTPAPGSTALPPADGRLELRLDQALWQRRSHYRFAPRALEGPALATLLRMAAGAQRELTLPDGTAHRMRMAPSAGGLRSLEVYAVVRAADGLPAGVHRWADGALIGVRGGDPTAALRSVFVQTEFARLAPVTLAIVARLDTTLAKYPARHYRTVHVDAGVQAQNLALVATALGLAGCVVSGFHDAALAELLDLPEAWFPVVLFPVGHRADG